MRKFLLFTLICVIFLGGCTAGRTDKGIYGFTERINLLDESLEMSVEGFITDTNEHLFYKFFNFGSAKLMLCFTYGDKGELKKMDISADTHCKDDAAAADFIENCLSAFINSEAEMKKLTEDIGLEKALLKNTAETKSAESEHFKLMLDVTAIGTVITVINDM